MASSSAPNIFSVSMSFSRETCRITDGSMFIGPCYSSPSAPALRPLEFQSRQPNIAETDIIGFAVLPINDTEQVSVDALERSAQISTARAGIARPVGGQGEHGRVGLHANAPSDESPGVVERVELPVEAGRRNFEHVPVRDLIGRV